jgi:PadR family transcriptional regulator PadR
MKFLSRQEELMLLTILLLRGNAYGIPIREKIAELTDKYWSIGAVYDILDRLTRKGLVSVTVSEPVKARGGKSRRYYRITKSGCRELEEIRALQEKSRAALRKARFEEV